MIFTGNKEKKSDYYDEIYKKGYNTDRYTFLYSTIMNLIDKTPNPRILELGCGLGDLGRMIIEKGYAYRGFDFSHEAIKICKEKCPTGNFYVGDVYNKKSFEPEDYNKVIALEVFEHVDDLKVLKNIQPGTEIFASVPDYDDVAHLRLYKDWKKDIIEYYKPFIHVYEIHSASL